MNEDIYLSIGETALKMGVSIDTLRRWDANGKFTALRHHKDGNRYYRKFDIDIYLKHTDALALEWSMGQSSSQPDKEFYCPDRAVFHVRLEYMKNDLKKLNDLKVDYSLIVAAIGEVGNNSYDHNLGNWPDVPGIFFSYDIHKRMIVLADRGQGILKTLSRVKTELKTEKDALQIAFTEIVTGRAPENRGNGLKFVKDIVFSTELKLFFQSGNSRIEFSEDNKILLFDASRPIQGCLAVFYF